MSNKLRKGIYNYYCEAAIMYSRWQESDVFYASSVINTCKLPDLIGKTQLWHGAEVVCVCVCVCTYISCWQRAGLSSCPPVEMNFKMSWLLMPGYGVHPREKTSQHVTPYDHYTHVHVGWLLSTIANNNYPACMRMGKVICLSVCLLSSPPDLDM